MSKKTTKYYGDQNGRKPIGFGTFLIFSIVFWVELGAIALAYSTLFDVIGIIGISIFSLCVVVLSAGVVGWLLSKKHSGRKSIETVALESEPVCNTSEPVPAPDVDQQGENSDAAAKEDGDTFDTTNMHVSSDDFLKMVTVVLFEHPTVSVSDLALRLNIKARDARTVIDKLREMNVVYARDGAGDRVYLPDFYWSVNEYKAMDYIRGRQLSATVGTEVDDGYDETDMFFKPNVYMFLRKATESMLQSKSASVSLLQKNLGFADDHTSTLNWLLTGLERLKIISPCKDGGERIIYEDKARLFIKSLSVEEYCVRLVTKSSNEISAYSASLPASEWELIDEEERWRKEMSGLNDIEYELKKIDGMEGHLFEGWCADLLCKNGFTDVAVTPGSNDQGVDITAAKDGVKYAVQCKRYTADLGNTPVQEVNAGKQMYNCHVGVVMTNRHFTDGAKALAEKTGILLWDRDTIERMLAKQAGYKT